MLQKTMVVVEGVGRMLDPKLDMWATSDPVVREWITRHLGPAGRLEQAAAGLHAFAAAAAKLPDLVTRAERVLARLDPPELPGEFPTGGLRIDETSIEAIGRAEARGSRLRWLALWAIAVLLGIYVLG
jgi:ubiquinone biosynthesis protein